MAYLYDLHIHTKESSNCGEVAAKDVVEHYKNQGYNGICITDHMNHSNARKYGKTYDEQAEAFLKGYRAAKEYANKDFSVMLGMEIRFLDHDNDYLVYGFDEEFIFKKDLTQFANLEEFKPFATEYNLVVFQAHPFREDMTIIDYNLLDGMEVYNGHGGHDSANDIAYKWAKKYNLRMSSSSDFHYVTNMEHGGIITEKPLENSFDIARTLLSGEYMLKIWTE